MSALLAPAANSAGKGPSGHRAAPQAQRNHLQPLQTAVGGIWPKDGSGCCRPGLEVQEETHFTRQDKPASKHPLGVLASGRSTHRKPHCSQGSAGPRTTEPPGPGKATRCPSCRNQTSTDLVESGVEMEVLPCSPLAVWSPPPLKVGSSHCRSPSAFLPPPPPPPPPTPQAAGLASSERRTLNSSSAHGC